MIKQEFSMKFSMKFSKWSNEFRNEKYLSLNLKIENWILILILYSENVENFHKLCNLQFQLLNYSIKFEMKSFTNKQMAIH